MEKKELLKLLNPNDDNYHSKFWNVAFQMYKIEYPKHTLSGMGCKSCRQTVYKWLRT